MCGYGERVTRRSVEKCTFSPSSTSHQYSSISFSIVNLISIEIVSILYFGSMFCLCLVISSVLIHIEPIAAYVCLFDFIKMYGTIDSVQKWEPIYLKYMTEILNGIHRIHKEKQYCYIVLKKCRSCRDD